MLTSLRVSLRYCQRVDKFVFFVCVFKSVVYTRFQSDHLSKLEFQVCNKYMTLHDISVLDNFHLHTHTHARTHVRTHERTHALTHTHTYAHAHAHTHTHTHTYTELQGRENDYRQKYRFD